MGKGIFGKVAEIEASRQHEWTRQHVGRRALHLGRLVRVRGVAAASGEDVRQSGGQGEESFGAVGQHVRAPGTNGLPSCGHSTCMA